MTGDPPSLAGGFQLTRALSLKMSDTVGAAGASGTSGRSSTILLEDVPYTFIHFKSIFSKHKNFIQFLIQFKK